MAGNRFGKYFRITTFGESHGPAIGVVIDGVRPGLAFDVGVIQRELDRRKPGQSRVTTPRKEADKVEVLSGVFEGRTTGTPLCMIIWNTDQRPSAYANLKEVFRPGHAGYTYLAKFGVVDYRGGGRSSGRETAGRVAAGALAKQLLQRLGTDIFGYTTEVAGIRAKTFDRDAIEKNILRCADSDAALKMEKAVLRAKKEGDSVGGIVEVTVHNPPTGLGDPVFDKLEADLAGALMSIGAVRGFEIGNGFSAARLRGSENNDPIYFDKKAQKFRTRTNNAGGIAGGISNGEDIVVRIAVKPTSSISKEQESASVDGRSARLVVEGRHDPCICPRVVPVAEAMVALTLYDHLLRQQLMRRGGSSLRKKDYLAMLSAGIEILQNEQKELLNGIGKLGTRK
jgi:chorismate synthase